VWDILFRDRREAGERLARQVSALFDREADLDAPVILALPRGGIPVALEVARALAAPLDLVIVRKIGVPWQPELAAGAVVNGDAPTVILNRDVIAAAGVGETELEVAKTREIEELRRRQARYLGQRPPVPIAGRDVVVVDDGVATGATTRAALRGVRRRGPRALILAVPVAPRDTLARLEREVDHVVCLETPEPFHAIGPHYGSFPQLSDDDVATLMAEADRLPGAARG